MKRESGFYWVIHEGKWVIAEWDSDTWFITSDNWYYSDEEFDEIDETQIVRK